MSIISYKGNLAQIPDTTPTGVGGLAVYNTSKQLADRFAQTFFGGFNVKDYNSAGVITVIGGGASGSATTTTGTVSGGSASLVVASAATFVIGQGILIKGAGTAGAHHVTVIDNIVGTTITLHVAAVTGVAGAVVQHDDTDAINAALAAAYNAGGGDVFVPSGFYRTNKPYNGSTNSILTLPQTLVGVASGIPVRVGLVGQTIGYLSVSGGVFVYNGGVLFSCVDAPTPSGTLPAWYSPAPFSLQEDTYNSAVWQFANCYFRSFTVLLPVSTPISGLMLSNTVQATVDDDTVLVASATAGDIAAPTSGTVGIYMPQSKNNVRVCVRQAQVIGFDHGIRGGEQLRLDSPNVSQCNVGLNLIYHFGLCSGEITIFFCPLMISQTGSTTAGASWVVDLQLNGETIDTAAWYKFATHWGVVDSNNLMRGTIRYYSQGPVVQGATLDVVGGGNAHFTNIYV